MAALLAVFIGNEARSGTALLPPRTFRLPGIASANAAALLQFSAVIPVFFFLTLYLQQVLGYSALRSGLAFLPLAAGVVAIAPAAARLVSRFGPAPTLIACPLVFACGAGLPEPPARARGLPLRHPARPGHDRGRRGPRLRIDHQRRDRWRPAQQRGRGGRPG